MSLINIQLSTTQFIAVSCCACVTGHSCTSAASNQSQTSLVRFPKVDNYSSLHGHFVIPSCVTIQPSTWALWCGTRMCVLQYPKALIRRFLELHHEPEQCENTHYFLLCFSLSWKKSLLVPIQLILQPQTDLAAKLGGQHTSLMANLSGGDEGP